jgi:ATP-dependent DNA helicase RecG
MLTSDKILQAIKGGESAQLEFKASVSDMAKIAQTVCAFSNDLNNYGTASHIFIGVADNGNISGADATDELLQRIAQIQSSNITPPPNMRSDVVEVSGKKIIVIEVMPSSSPPVRCGGVSYVRQLTTNAKATPDQENTLVQLRGHRNVPFDARGIADTSLNDLEIPRFKLVYLQQAVSSEVLEQNGRPTEAQLAGLKMIDDMNRVTPTGLLSLGVNPLSYLPNAYIQFRRVYGNDVVGETRDDAVISGTIDIQVKLIEDKLRANNSESLTIGGPRHVRQAEYPMVALQQLVRNAIMHRDYEIAAPIRVTWFDDSIEIQSPGLPFGIPTGDFGKPRVYSYRNPNISEAMRNMGLAEKYGVGIQLARQELEKGNNPPLELDAQVNYTLATVRAAR